MRMQILKIHISVPKISKYFESLMATFTRYGYVLVVLLVLMWIANWDDSVDDPNVTRIVDGKLT